MGGIRVNKCNAVRRAWQKEMRIILNVARIDEPPPDLSRFSGHAATSSATVAVSPAITNKTWASLLHGI